MYKHSENFIYYKLRGNIDKNQYNINVKLMSIKGHWDDDENN